jgi:hypothetical protein
VSLVIELWDCLDSSINYENRCLDVPQKALDIIERIRAEERERCARHVLGQAVYGHADACACPECLPYVNLAAEILDLEQP